MLVIRDIQKQKLGSIRQERFLARAIDHLRTHFPSPLAQIPAPQFEQLLRPVLARAASHGLTTERDVCRYLNLAACYGWNFDRDPALSWMRQYLDDSDVSTPGERLDLLVQECLRRNQVEEHNRLQRQAGL